MEREFKFYIFVLFAGLVGLYFFQIDKTVYVFKRGHVHPSPGIKFFTMGYDNLLTGAMWISMLPEDGTCDQTDSKEVSYNGGTTLKEVLSKHLKPSRCHLSWVYEMLNVMSILTPRFYSIYSIGGTLLSVIVDDREGAKLIFDKGVKEFPTDWRITFQAGYHYLYELQNAKRATELLTMSYLHGGPSYIPSLLGGLYTEMGQLSFAKKVIEDFIKTHPGGMLEDKAIERLKEVNRLIDEKLRKNNNLNH